MLPAARLIENVGVGAYLGAAPLIQDTSILAAAASIATVEARHQTILNVLSDGTSIPQAFDIPLLPEEVVTITSPFISNCDLGIQSLNPLTVTNQGPIVPGTSLTFQAAPLNGIDPNVSSNKKSYVSPFLLTFVPDLVLPNARRWNGVLSDVALRAMRRPNWIERPRSHLRHERHAALER